jgi:hypothetical protein
MNQPTEAADLADFALTTITQEHAARDFFRRMCKTNTEVMDYLDVMLRNTTYQMVSDKMHQMGRKLDIATMIRDIRRSLDD